MLRAMVCVLLLVVPAAVGAGDVTFLQRSALPPGGESVDVTFIPRSALPIGDDMVDVTFIPESPVVNTGETVRVAVVLGEGELLFGVQIVLTWDPAVLGEIADAAGGDWDWHFAEFPPDGQGFNDSLADGDAGWIAGGMGTCFEPPGTVTHFEWPALNPGQCEIGFNDPFTIVCSCPAFDVTGETTPCTITVLPLPGDLTRDGVVDAFDIDPFVRALAVGPYDEAADINGDDVVDAFDIDPFIALLTD